MSLHEATLLPSTWDHTVKSAASVPTALDRKLSRPFSGKHLPRMLAIKHI